jgi:SAM-dependent methyltransferase
MRRSLRKDGTLVPETGPIGSCVKFSIVSLLPDYSRQADRYDETRGASPSVLRPLREALKGAPGRRLADVGGGTGNYALALSREGWNPVVVDRSPEMLARAAAKGLETVEAPRRAGTATVLSWTKR